MSGNPNSSGNDALTIDLHDDPAEIGLADDAAAPLLDPLQEAFWLPAMAVVWAASRDPALVIKVWPLLSGTGADRWSRVAAVGGFYSVDTRSAEELLMQKLRTGSVSAVGSKAGSDELNPIPREQWSHLAFTDDIADGAFRIEGQLVFQRVLLSVDHILKAFPRPAVAEETTPSETLPGNNRAAAAVAAVFPNGVPPALLRKERDGKLNDWLKDQGSRPLAERTWRAHFNSPEK